MAIGSPDSSSPGSQIEPSCRRRTTGDMCPALTIVTSSLAGSRTSTRNVMKRSTCNSLMRSLSRSMALATSGSLAKQKRVSADSLAMNIAAATP